MPMLGLVSVHLCLTLYSTPAIQDKCNFVCTSFFLSLLCYNTKEVIQIDRREPAAHVNAISYDFVSDKYFLWLFLKLVKFDEEGNMVSPCVYLNAERPCHKIGSRDLITMSFIFKPTQKCPRHSH